MEGFNMDIKDLVLGINDIGEYNTSKLIDCTNGTNVSTSIEILSNKQVLVVYDYKSNGNSLSLCVDKHNVKTEVFLNDCSEALHTDDDDFCEYSHINSELIINIEATKEYRNVYYIKDKVVLRLDFLNSHYWSVYDRDEFDSLVKRLNHIKDITDANPLVFNNEVYENVASREFQLNSNYIDLEFEYRIKGESIEELSGRRNILVSDFLYAYENSEVIPYGMCIGVSDEKEIIYNCLQYYRGYGSNVSIAWFITPIHRVLFIPDSGSILVGVFKSITDEVANILVKREETLYEKDIKTYVPGFNLSISHIINQLSSLTVDSKESKVIIVTGKTGHGKSLVCEALRFANESFEVLCLDSKVDINKAIKCMQNDKLIIELRDGIPVNELIKSLSEVSGVTSGYKLVEVVREYDNDLFEDKLKPLDFSRIESIDSLEGTGLNSEVIRIRLLNKEIVM